MLTKEDIESAQVTYKGIAKDLFLQLMKEYVEEMGEDADAYVFICKIESEVTNVSK